MVRGPWSVASHGPRTTDRGLSFPWRALPWRLRVTPGELLDQLAAFLIGVRRHDDLEFEVLIAAAGPHAAQP